MTPLPLERFRFSSMKQSPLQAIWQRVLVALGLLVLVALVTYLGRGGYIDNSTGRVPNLLDSLYYATVTVTTTGYGDIVPESAWARFVTTFVVTPARVIFLVILVGTTLEVLASKTRLIYKMRHWQEDLKDHTILCGFGVKGRAAYAYLQGGENPGKVVVIDTDSDALEAANALGLSGVVGRSSDRNVLTAVGVEKAKTVIIAVREDDGAVLTTLRVRELNPDVTIVASCRNEDNTDLLDSSGADEVIVSSASAGRILGLAATAPAAARVINDLLTSGDGLDIEEREVNADEIGLTEGQDEAAIAISRAGKILRLNDPGLGQLRAGDRIISITEHPDNA